MLPHPTVEGVGWAVAPLHKAGQLLKPATLNSAVWRGWEACCDHVRHFIKIPGSCINICRIGAWTKENYSQNKLLVLPNKYGCLSTNDTQTLKKYYVNHMLQLRYIHLFSMFKMPQMAYPTNTNTISTAQRQMGLDSSLWVPHQVGMTF